MNFREADIVFVTLAKPYSFRVYLMLLIIKYIRRPNLVTFDYEFIMNDSIKRGLNTRVSGLNNAIKIALFCFR